MRDMRLALSFFSCLFWASYSYAQSDVKFEIRQIDGRLTTGKVLNPFYQNLEEKIVLDGKSYDDAGNPVRSILAVDAVGAPFNGPWVEFRNGDRLPARITRWIPARQSLEDGANGDQVLLTLELGGGQNDLTTTQIAVRPDAIARCYDSAASSARYPSGTVVTGDGRRIDARSIRYREAGLDCLTETGIVQIPYDRLATVVWPHSTGDWNARGDTLWSEAAASLPAIARFRTTRGMSLTAGNQLIRRGREFEKNIESIAIRPNWSWQTLRIPPDRVRRVVWRNDREVPLTALPHTFEIASAGAKLWPPRLDANVLGEELNSAGMRVDSGWGTHAGTKIVCELPGDAQRISGWVGIDRCVGRGGCAKAKIVGDRDEILWHSEYLLGNQQPQRFDVETRGAKSVTLSVEDAHDGRPSGADPWDIRDHVDWLNPIVLLKQNDLAANRLAAAASPGTWMPALAGFQVAERDRRQIELRPYWVKNRGFAFIVVPTNEEAIDNDGVLFERTTPTPITLRNAWLQISVGFDVARRHHHVIVAADGEELNSSAGTRLYDGTRTLNRGGFDNRSYGLAKYIGKSPTFSIRLAPDQKKSPHSGTEFDTIAFGPLVTDLPADEKPLLAEIPLPTPLNTIPAWNNDWTWQPGKTFEGKPLSIRGLPFAAGHGIGHGMSASFRLDPSWKRFVAVLGVCDGGGDVVGPVEILIDDQPFWKSPGKFDARTAALQLDLHLPAEAKTLTIRSPAANGVLGLGNAGFMQD